MRSSADALPLLSLTLAGLYDDYAGDSEITLDEYESMGGMRRVVESVVDGLLSTDPDARRASCSSCGTLSFRGWRPLPRSGICPFGA